MSTSIVGIDVASRKLDMCIEQDGKQQYATIENTAQAIAQYAKEHKLSRKNCLVGLEATNDYHFVVTRFFLKKGIPVRIMNPIVTKRYTRTTVRGKKTDKTDAQNIARLAAEGEGELASLSNVDNREKELLRLSRSLVKLKVQLTLRLQSLRRKQLKNTGRIERKLEKIEGMLFDVAEELVGEVTEDRSHDEELIDSIPGFSTKLSAIVHHELGDVTRFKNARSLASFAGLDPRVVQSGGRLHTSGRLMKRGSPYLRSALFLAANVAYHYDEELGEYYAKKKAEGRSHKEVLCIISRKLLYRIWAVLKEQREYVVKQNTN
ncbi:MAG: IS110 family transposase [Candidatus Andersenbacteria bacterium]|nr:IS110 family transposase [Candidatus Andersenbacteria bacterium]MBI3250987.1 IS110 family transposase [Candidatus Andersenbacteria bacterium]